MNELHNPPSPDPDLQPRRMHIALDVTDLEQSVSFYRAFFDSEPVKRKPRYAKFTLDNPPLALALLEAGQRKGRGQLNHLGIQVASSATVQDAISRLEKVGLASKVEREVDCCYARQDKVWAQDPDGNRWEVYTVLADADQLTSSSSEQATSDDDPSRDSAAACCAPACC